MSAARVLVITVVTAIVALVGPNVVLTRTASLWPWLATAESGSDLAVLGAARAADPDAVDVVVLGSSMAASNVSTWMLQRDSGRGVVNLGVNGANAVQAAMWVDEVVRLGPDVVVWMSGPMSLEEQRLDVPNAFDWGIALAAWGPTAAVRSDVLSRAAIEASLVLRLRRVPRLAWDGRLAESTVHIRDRPPLPPRRFRRFARAKAAEVEQAAVSADGPGGRAMRAAIDTLTEHDIRVVLVPAPVHPSVLQGRYFLPEHLHALTTIAHDTGAQVLMPDAQPEWDAEDFRDPIHLGHSGQGELTRTLIEVVQ